MQKYAYITNRQNNLWNPPNFFPKIFSYVCKMGSIMNNWDWMFLVLLFGSTLLLGIYGGRGSSKNFKSYFLGGKNLKWYVAGISMVATTFAVDTPLAITEMVYKYGISGNWQWWNMTAGGLLTAIFFAKLWYRSGVNTEAELIELRYSGTPAKYLRIFKSIYLGLFINVLIMGWVNLAFVNILEIFFELSKGEAILWAFITMIFVAIYSTFSGLRGVILADNLQFIVAMAGCILLAIFVINSDKIGGLSGLQAKVNQAQKSFFPQIGNNSEENIYVLPLYSFLTFFVFSWWATWYPGNEPGGGGYVAQRILSTKDEKNAGLSAFLFQILNLGIRPWPWIIVALAAVYLYPGQAKHGYILAMRDFLPSGFKGIMLAAFLSAYMSTISTHLNWGSSYLVNDILPLVKKNSSDKNKILFGKICIAFFIFLSGILTFFMESISGAWLFLMECGAGLGTVLIFRWFWWRINAWSEITATVFPFISIGVIYTLNYLGLTNILFPYSFLITFLSTTIAWLLVTFFTKPEPIPTLHNFYNQAKPYNKWPKFITDNRHYQPKTIANLSLIWGFSVIMTYSFLFLIGAILLKPIAEQLLYALIFIISTIGLWLFGKKTFFK